MKTSQSSGNHCRLIRKGLFGSSGHDPGKLPFWGDHKGIDFESPWIQRHIAGCPRCQRRFAHLSRVNLAFSLLRSQSQPLTLMTEANQRTVRVLQKAVRQTSQALDLKTALPNPTIWDHLRMARYHIANMAACVTLLVLFRMGIFSTIQNAENRGRKAMYQYYAQHLGTDISDELN